MTMTGARVQRRKVNNGEAVTSAMLNEMSTEAQVSALDGILSALLATPGAVAPTFSGGFIGRGFRAVRSGGARTLVFEAGSAVFSREMDGGLDPTQAAYANLPMMVPFFNLLGTTTVTVDAHDATNPRYDVITVKPVETDEDQDDVRERTAGPGTQQVIPRYRRSRWYPQITVTKGTPAGSPSLPTYPTDELVIAHVLVPATSGNVTVYDKRNLLTVGSTVSQAPPTGFANVCVVGGLVTSLTSGLGISISDGTALVGSGRVRYFTGTTATLVADGTNPVIYLIEASNSDGAIRITRGTPAASPVEPTITAVPLAYITVPAGATTLTSSNLELLSTRGPYQGSMADIPIVFFDASIAAESANARVLTLQAKTWSGEDVAVPVAFELYVGSAAVEPADNSSANVSVTVTTGTQIAAMSSPTNAGIFRTNAAGLGVLSLGTTQTGAFFITAKPIGLLTTSTPAMSSPDRQRYRPGGPLVIQANWT